MSTRLRTRDWWGEERDVQIQLFDLRAAIFGSFRLELDNYGLSSRDEKTFELVRPTHSPEIALMTPKYLFNAQDVKVFCLGVVV